MSYSAQVVDSLKGFGDAALDAVTAGASIFFDRRWFRLLESLDLPHLAKGELTLRYVAVSAGDGLVAVCPFIVTRSPTLVSHYSLEKFFFISWREALARLNPEGNSWSRWVGLATDGYRHLARLLRTGSEGWVMAVSPLSFRGGIACKALPAGEQRQVHGAVLEALKDVARAERLPLCFYAVQEEDALQATLKERGFEEMFLSYDMVLDDLGQYLERFSGKVRRNIRAEMKRPEKLGYRFEARTDHDALRAQLAAFYDATYSKYGDEHFLHPPAFWTSLEHTLGAHAEQVLALKDGAPVGFCTLLYKGEEMFAYRMGRQPEPDGQEPPVYFSLILYEPIKRALELGVKRLWLSGGAWDVKRRRGATGHALYSYFWFPNRRSRLVLGSFFSLFGRMSRDEMSRMVAPKPEEGE